jgi:phospholipase/carboxylesterase
MIHKFIQGSNPKRPTLLLLHGTGGTENDLLSIAQMLDHEASILSLRGDVMEQGMTRFFKRLSPGVFDYEDITFRVNQLDAFLDKACLQYGLDRDDLFGVGYSNGANMLAQLLLKKPNSLHHAIFMHPMDIDPRVEPSSLLGHHVLVTAGENDPIVTKQETDAFVQRFQAVNASIRLEWFQQGHQVSREEVQTMLKWYQSLIIDPEQQRD